MFGDGRVYEPRSSVNKDFLFFIFYAEAMLCYQTEFLCIALNSRVMSLQSNAVSHWLGANLESALQGM